MLGESHSIGAKENGVDSPVFRPMNQPHIAICFFGITRSLSFTINSIEANVLAPAREHGDITVLSHFFTETHIENPRSGEFGPLELGDHSKLPNDWLALEKPNACLEQWAFEDIKCFGDAWNDNFASLRNLVHQLHSLRSVTLAALKTQPDLVVFCRPDLTYHDNASAMIGRALRMRQDAVWTPSWQVHEGYNDRFAIASGPRAISAYGCRVEAAAAYCRETKSPLHAERLLRFALEREDIARRPLRLRASRTRVGGAVVHENFIPSWQMKLWYRLKHPVMALARRSGLRRAVRRWRTKR